MVTGFGTAAIDDASLDEEGGLAGLDPEPAPLRQAFRRRLRGGDGQPPRSATAYEHNDGCDEKWSDQLEQQPSAEDVLAEALSFFATECNNHHNALDNNKHGKTSLPTFFSPPRAAARAAALVTPCNAPATPLKALESEIIEGGIESGTEGGIEDADRESLLAAVQFAVGAV
jgi:hypothetical protein